MIKGVLLDYGGTIDTNGLHWGAVLWNSYQKANIAIEKDLFSKAYSFGERSLAINPIIKPSHSFYDTLYLKIEQQFSFLHENGIDLDTQLIEQIAEDCNEFARRTVLEAKPVLELLSEKYPLVLVSNFYGNIHSVLEIFGIQKLFTKIIESAVVGVRKPDPAIYQLGAESIHFSPKECVVIGDSFSKDIVPAKKLGSKAIWLNVTGWEEKPSINQEYQADAETTDFASVPSIINKLNQ